MGLVERWQHTIRRPQAHPRVPLRAERIRPNHPERRWSGEWAATLKIAALLESEQSFQAQFYPEDHPIHLAGALGGVLIEAARGIAKAAGQCVFRHNAAAHFVGYQN